MYEFVYYISKFIKPLLQTNSQKNYIYLCNFVFNIFCKNVVDCNQKNKLY